MISELLYWGAIGLVFFIFFIAYVLFAAGLATDGIKNQREADLYVISGALGCFPFVCVLLIGLVLAIAHIVGLITGSYPGWFFLSVEYLAKTFIVLVVSFGVSRSLDYSNRRVNWEKITAGPKSNRALKKIIIVNILFLIILGSILSFLLL
jgi:hypothetical protein